MAKVSAIQGNFNGGEISPLLYGRPDVDKYKTGLKTCENFMPLVQGPIERRPGTHFLVETKTSSKACRLVSFEFSTTQAYIIEMGDQYMRFIKDHGQIISGTPIELATTYLEADLFQFKFTQSADVLYITHPSYPVRKLQRTSHTAWTIADVDFLDGPYLNTNITTTTLLLSATSGSVTVTASAITGINNDTGFQTTDVGRLIRWKDAAANWTWLEITARASTTSVTALFQGPAASATTATTEWRLGLWSATTGYPGAATFHQDRLALGGGVDTPQRVDLSRTADFENMAPTEVDGTVVDDNAIGVTLSADNVNVIRWLADDEKGLLAGTVGGEWVIRPTEVGGVLTPSNVQAKRSSGYGSANIAPIRAGRALLFVQRAKRKLRELAFVFEDDGFRAPDMTLISEHVTRGGLVEAAYQAEPQSIIWLVRADGTLLGLTYDRNQSVIGWHRHIIGGKSDAAGTTQALVESVATIPNPAGTADELYVLVNRYIDGATVRYIEYLEDFWDGLNDQEDAFFVDSGLTLDSPIDVTGATSADPVVVTAASHSIADGSTVRFVDVGGMTDINKMIYRIASTATNTMELFNTADINVAITGATAANPVVITAVAHGLSNSDEIAIFDVGGMVEIDGFGFTVANVSADTFELSGINGTGYTAFTTGGVIHPAIDGSAYTAYTTGGEVRERVTSITGLAHLEGQTVSILAEGATHPDKVVSSGGVTLNSGTSKAQIGLAYVSDAETLRYDVGAKDGTAQGKIGRMHRVILRFFQTLGGKVGPDADNLDDIILREGGDTMDRAVTPFTGDFEKEWDGEYSSDEHIFIRQDQPLPMTLEAVMPQMNTQDR